LIKEFTNLEEIFNHFNLDLKNIELFKEWNNNFLIHVLERPPVSQPQIMSLENLMDVDLKKEIDLKNEEINKKNQEINKKNQEINKKNKKIEKLLNSNSWKITKPLRKLKSIAKHKRDL
jgi:hypothetical protein